MKRKLRWVLITVILLCGTLILILGWMNSGRSKTAPNEAVVPDPTVDVPSSDSQAGTGREKQRALFATNAGGGRIAATNSGMLHYHGTVLDGGGASVPEALVLGSIGDQFDQTSAERYRLCSQLESTSDSSGVIKSRTDIAGNFDFYAPRTEEIRLIVSTPGYVVADARIRIRASDTDVDLGKLYLQSGMRLAGRVVTAAGEGVRGAAIVFLEGTPSLADSDSSPSGPCVATSGEGGLFVTQSLPLGRWEVKVELRENAPLYARGLVDVVGTSDGHIFTLPRSGIIGGQIIGAQPSAWEGAEIALEATSFDQKLSAWERSQLMRTTPVRAGGSFLCSGLYAEAPGGTYRVSLRRKSPTGNTLLSEPSIATVGTPDLQLRLVPTCNLAFQLWAKNSVPVVDAAVSISIWSEVSELSRANPVDGSNIRRGSDGRVTITGLPVTSDSIELRLGIEKDGYARHELSGVHISPNANLDLGRIELLALSSVHVCVVAAESGAPIAGAKVAVVSVMDIDSVTRALSLRNTLNESDYIPPRTLRVADESGCTVVPLGIEEYQITAFAVGRSASAPIRADGRTPPRELRFELTTGGTALVRVVDEGRPVTGVDVVECPQPNSLLERILRPWLPAEGLRHSTDEQGLAVFAHLWEGPHQFRVIVSKAASAQESLGSLDVHGTESGTITIQVSHVLKLEGTVTGGGSPLGGARVLLVRSMGENFDAPQAPFGGGYANSSSTETDGAGAFVVPTLFPGQYLLRLQHPTRTGYFEKNIWLHESIERVQIDWPVLLLEGLVIDETGQPVEGSMACAVRPSQALGSFRALLDSVDGSDRAAMDFALSPKMSDSQGQLVFSGLPLGCDLIILACKRGMQLGRSDVFRLDTGASPPPVIVKLSHGCSLEVNLQYAIEKKDRNPAGYRVHVERFDPSPQSQEAYTDSSGTAILPYLAPGHWRVALTHHFNFPVDVPNRELDLQTGDKARLVFHLPW